MIQYKNKFLLFFLFLCFPLFSFAKVFLVSVGISNYPGTENDLRLPVDDAKTIAGIYKKASDVEAHVILDSLATPFNVTMVMNKVFSQANEDDIVVFFYSGHGVSGALYLYNGVLNFSAIRNAMAKSKSKSKMIFLDACFSGKIRHEENKETARDSESSAKKANVMLFLSSKNQETSFESSDMRNSMFTAFLAKGLYGFADGDQNGVITAFELFKYVHYNVKKKSGDKQHPVMWGRFPHDMTVMYVDL